MNNKKRSKFTKKYTLVFMLITLAVILSLSLGSVSAADWTVGPGGTHNYTSIQDAINNAYTLSGDTISVYDNNGTPYTYNENVVVNKTNLTVQSTGQVTVSGSSNPANPVFTINNQGAYAYITGFTLSGSTNSAGVLVTGTNNVTLNNLTINNCQQGVLMTSTSTNITLESLNISSTQGHGIYFNGDLTNVTVNGTQISSTGNNAIEKYEASNLNGLSIINTTITNPIGRGIFLTTWSDLHLKNVLIDNVNITGATYDGIYIYMGHTNSGNVTITNSSITNSSLHGMALYTRGTLHMANNTFSDNGYGGGDNQYYGLYVNGAYNTEINIANDNRLVENRNGIRLDNVGNETNQITVIGTQLINNAGYPVWINNGHYITITNVDFDDAATQTATGARIIQAIHIDGTSTNITLENLNISSTQAHGIYLTGDLTNININGTQISSTGNNAIEKYEASNLNGLNIINTTITNPNGRGIFLTTWSDLYLKNVLIDNVNITGAIYDGIYIYMGHTNSGNVTITNTTINNSSMQGMNLNTRGILHLANNTLTHNGYGGGDNVYYGLYVNGAYNTEVNIANDNRLVENRNGIRLDNVGNETNPITVIGTQLINNAGYPVWINNGHYITINGANFDDAATQTATGARIIQAIHIDGTSTNITLENLNISSTQAHGIYLTGDLTNININGTQISSTGNNAIEKYEASNLNGLNIINTTITNPNGRGIFLTTWSDLHLKNVLIDNVNITGATYDGIYIYMGHTNNGNVTITNSSITNSSMHGMILNTRGTLHMVNNTFSDNGYGGGDNQYYGLYVNGAYNTEISISNDNKLIENRNGVKLDNVGNETNQITIIGTQLINNAGYPVWINNGHYITINGANFDDAAAQTATGARILQAIRIEGISSNITLESLNISSTQGHGIYFNGDLTNITVNGTQISSTGNNAIEKYEGSNLNGLNIINTTITNPNGRGIFLTTWSDLYLKNVLVDNVNITGALYDGIYIYMGNTNSGNVTITNNSFSNNGEWGIQLIGNNNPTVTLNNNTISHNSNGLLLQSISGGNFQDNQLINNTDGDLYSTADTNNTFTRLTMGLAHPTTITFDYINGIIMNGVENPPVDPSGLFNIGKYVDIQNLGSSTVNLKIHYNSSDVVDLNEASLKNFHFNTNWVPLPNPNGVNITERYVYADGISFFSTFAPMGQKPPAMINVTDVSGLNGQTVNLEAALTSQGTSLAGKTIDFSVNGISIGSNVTDDNGIATLNYLITQTPGTYTINATFNGDGDYIATDATSTLTVHKNSTSIVLSNVTGVNGQNVQLQAILTNQDGTPLTGKTIDFIVNGTSVGSNVTDGTGQAMLNWIIPSNWALGNKIIQAEFLGTDSYNTSEGTATLTVEVKPTAKASIKGGTFNANKNVYLSMNKAGTIYYTRNGSTPTTASTKYTGYLTISSTTTLKFIAVDLGGNISPVYTEKYVIDKIAPKVTYTYPKNLKTGQSRTATLYLKFSESLKTSTYWSKIYVKDLKTGKKVSITKYIKGNILYIKTKYKRASLRWFQVYVPYKAVKDFAGNNLVKTYTYKFKTKR